MMDYSLMYRVAANHISKVTEAKRIFEKLSNEQLERIAQNHFSNPLSRMLQRLGNWCWDGSEALKSEYVVNDLHPNGRVKRSYVPTVLEYDVVKELLDSRSLVGGN